MSSMEEKHEILKKAMIIMIKQHPPAQQRGSPRVSVWHHDIITAARSVTEYGVAAAANTSQGRAAMNTTAQKFQVWVALFQAVNFHSLAYKLAVPSRWKYSPGKFCTGSIRKSLQWPAIITQ